MAIKQAFSRISGHKHLIKTITEKIVILTVLLMTVTANAIPQHALAFETELYVSPARSLDASVQVMTNKEFIDNSELVFAIDYSDRLAGSVLANPAPQSQTKQPERTLLAHRDNKIINLPAGNSVLVLQGEASYYSWAGCLGCNPNRIMANGQQLNDNALTMAIGAHLSYLVGHQAKVTNLITGQSVDVRITDTGGFYQAKYGSRVADLTIATKQAIGMNGGLGQVKVEVY